jgi:hypothetical protein
MHILINNDENSVLALVGGILSNMNFILYIN